MTRNELVQVSRNLACVCEAIETQTPALRGASAAYRTVMDLAETDLLSKEEILLVLDRRANSFTQRLLDPDERQAYLDVCRLLVPLVNTLWF